MKVKLIFICIFINSLIVCNLQAAGNPDFSCVGFAAMNGGTTGGQGGQEVTVVNLEQFKRYVAEKDATPRIIYVQGTLEGAGGGEIVAIGSNKTVIGIGEEGKVSKVQFYCKNSKNLIFRNLLFTMKGSTLNSDADCISIATTGSDKCQKIWVDHCTFDNEVGPVANPSASQKDQYDGLLDIKKNSEYITISWCVFKNHYKGILVGYTSSDTYDRKITMHHNAFINISSRTPSYRGGTAHLYNNYWQGCRDAASGKYFSTGVNCREGACLKVESNYFKDMDKTIYCAWDDVSVAGYANWENNEFINSKTPESDSKFELCSSFTPPYSVIIDDVNDVYSLVTQYAGIGKLEDPENIPAPEQGGGNENPVIGAPVLANPYNLSEKGFNISWSPVDGAAQYLVAISHEENKPGLPAPIFRETFDQFTTALTTNALTKGPTDNSANKFNVTGGGSSMACKEDGTMDLAGGRFSILNLDLSAAPALYLTCKYVEGAGSFLVSVDYEGTSSSTGNIYKVLASSISTSYTTLSIPLTGGTNASKIQLRTESGTAIRIDAILISSSKAGPEVITDTYTVDSSVTSYSFENLTAGIEYTIEVVAKNAEGKTGNASNAIYVTPNVASAVETVINDCGDVISIQYYTLSGNIISEPQQSGIYIKRSVYSKGIVKTEKIIR